MKAYDGYKEFYKELNKGGPQEVPIPADYKDTVLYVLSETGLDSRDVEAISRYLRIGKCETHHAEERHTLVEVAFKMNLSAAGVLQKITHLMYRCWVTSRKELLGMGIAAYREKYGQTYGLSDEIKYFQEEYQKRDDEYQELLRQANDKKRQRDQCINLFAQKHKVDKEVVRRIAGKKPMDLSLTEVEEIFHGGIIERWYQ